MTAVAGLRVIGPPHELRIVPTVLCMAVLALATTVSFDTPFGFTVPTQLAFVPLVLAAPPAIIPLAVVVALVVGRSL